MTHDQIIAEFIARDDRNEIADHEFLRVLLDFWVWLEREYCIIRFKNGVLGALIPNRSQRVIFAEMLVQAAAGRPIRLIILKARKQGASTFIEAFIIFACAHFSDRRGLMVAHEHFSTLDIFGISRLMAEQYGGGVTSRRQEVRYMNRSVFACRTAGGKGVGAGGTPSFLHKSELALWDGMKKEETSYTVNNAVPFLPGTMIVEESTARGRELFYEHFEGAADPANPYNRIFLPWFLDDDCTEPVAEIFELDADELAVKRLAAESSIELTYEHLQWRRSKILEIGPIYFKQEFPSTPEEAVQGMTDLVLPGMGACVIDELPFAVTMLSPDALVGGIDYGFHDPTVILTAYYVDQTLYIGGLYRASRETAEEQSDGLVGGHTYYGDPSGPQQRAELVKIINRNPDLMDTRIVPAPRKKAGPATSIVSSEWIAVMELMRHGRLKLVRGCDTQIVLEADNLAWNSTTGKPNMVHSELCGHFDTLDALRYLVAGVVRRLDAATLAAPRRVEPDRRQLSRREMLRK